VERSRAATFPGTVLGMTGGAPPVKAGPLICSAQPSIRAVTAGAMIIATTVRTSRRTSAVRLTAFGLAENLTTFITPPALLLSLPDRAGQYFRLPDHGLMSVK
jgi:hypothetical protein